MLARRGGLCFFLWVLLYKPQMLSFMDKTRDGSWPQNIDSWQYTESYEVWGSFRLSYRWIYWRGSSWIEHRTRKKKVFVSQSKTNSFQDLLHETVTVSKPHWETYLFWVLDEQMHVLYQIRINTVFLGNTHLIIAYCDLTSVRTHNNSYWSNLLLKLPVGESMDWWER